MNKRGQALVEYILIIVLIVVVVVGLVSLVSTHLNDSITKLICELTNKRYIVGEEPGEGCCVNPKSKVDTCETQDDEEN